MSLPCDLVVKDSDALVRVTSRLTILLLGTGLDVGRDIICECMVLTISLYILGIGWTNRLGLRSMQPM